VPPPPQRHLRRPYPPAEVERALEELVLAVVVAVHAFSVSDIEAELGLEHASLLNLGRDGDRRAGWLDELFFLLLTAGLERCSRRRSIGQSNADIWAEEVTTVTSGLYTVNR
jgi:hypothetical protein